MRHQQRHLEDCNLNGVPDECEADCNANGVPDDCDITTGGQPDCNQNGVPDECDISSGTSQDCNLNGVPDECEPDCNANGVADACDISSGTSPDCNSNGVPDECDIASSTSQDCNSNGMPDECEADCNANGVPDDCDITTGGVPDCNLNGVPDECDISSGTSQDCNLNGVPDECEADCNANGVPDDCDITSGTSPDCNSNGVPDECDIASSTSEDKNGDGIPDECQGADLAIDKTDSPDPVRSGQNLTYYLVVTNNGPLEATSVTVVDALPLECGISIESTAVEQGTVSVLNGILTADLGSLAYGESTTVTVVLGTSGRRILSNAASVTANEPDPDLANNSDSENTTVEGAFQVLVDDTFTTQANWFPFAPDQPGLMSTQYDVPGTALKVNVVADPVRFRINGWFTLQQGYVPYASIGPDNLVRGKFYVYAGAQANPGNGTEIPNVRVRLSNRFAVGSLLEIFNHLNSDPASLPFAQELRPSTLATSPSLYRVDFDQVDVPYLAANAATEGIMRAFEALSFDPQDNGYVALAECIVGIYPAAALDPCVAPVKVYQASASDAGDFALALPGAALTIHNYFIPVVPGVITEAFDPPADLPFQSEGTFGVTLDTTQVPGGPHRNHRAGVLPGPARDGCGPHPGAGGCAVQGEVPPDEHAAAQHQLPVARPCPHGAVRLHAQAGDRRRVGDGPWDADRQQRHRAAGDAGTWHAEPGPAGAG